VLPSGQKLQFTASEDVALQRPGRLYVERGGDLGDRQFRVGAVFCLLHSTYIARGSTFGKKPVVRHSPEEFSRIGMIASARHLIIPRRSRCGVLFAAFPRANPCYIDNY